MTDIVEVPQLDIRDDEAFLRKALDTLAVLDQFKISFNDQKAVCQAQIKALVENCEVSLDQRFPLVSYSQRPSAYGLDAATESILKRSGQLLLDILKKAGEVIVKILRWFRDLLKSLFGRAKQQRKRVVLIRTLSEANADAAPVARTVDPSFVPGGSELSSAIKRYQDNYNGLAHAVLTEASIVGLLKATGLALPSLIKLLEDKVGLIEKVMSEREPNPGILAQTFANLTAPMPLGQLGNLAARYRAPIQANTLASFCDAVKAQIDQLHETLPANAMEWQIAVKVVTNPQSGFDEPVVAVPDAIEHAVDSLTERVVKLMGHSTLAQLPYDLSHQYEGALMTVVGDVQGLSHFAESVRLVLDCQFAVADSLYRCEVAQFESYRELAKSSNDEALVAEMNRIQHKLRASIMQ